MTNHFERFPVQKKLMIPLKEGEHLIEMTLEMENEDLLEEEGIQQNFEETIYLRSSDFQSFSTVLNYNKIPFRVRPIT